MTTSRISRRAALKRMAAAGLAAPFVFRTTAGAAPSETVRHASFGANGQALSDIEALTASKNLKLVAVAEVDLSRAAAVKKLFPDVTVYQDWRELLDKEKNLNSVNVSTPDHMHAPITMRAMQQGLNVYTQKPLTQTIYETRQLTKAAKDKKLVTQMGIQIHSHAVHKTVVALVQAGAIGKVKEVHSWSGKGWGDKNPRPDRSDPVPPELNWDDWLGVAAERPFIKGILPPRRVAEAARLRLRHVRRHGLSHPRPGVRLAGPDGPDDGAVGGGGAERRRLAAGSAGEVRVPRHEVHGRNAHAELVSRRPPAAGRGGQA